MFWSQNYKFPPHLKYVKKTQLQNNSILIYWYSPILHMVVLFNCWIIAWDKRTVTCQFSYFHRIFHSVCCYQARQNVSVKSWMKTSLSWGMKMSLSVDLVLTKFVFFALSMPCNQVQYSKKYIQPFFHLFSSHLGEHSL